MSCCRCARCGRGPMTCRFTRVCAQKQDPQFAGALTVVIDLKGTLVSASWSVRVSCLRLGPRAPPDLTAPRPPAQVRMAHRQAPRRGRVPRGARAACRSCALLRGACVHRQVRPDAQPGNASRWKGSCHAALRSEIAMQLDPAGMIFRHQLHRECTRLSGGRHVKVQQPRRQPPTRGSPEHLCPPLVCCTGPQPAQSRPPQSRYHRQGCPRVPIHAGQRRRRARLRDQGGRSLWAS